METLIPMTKVPHGVVRAPRFELYFRILIDPVQGKKPKGGEQSSFMGNTLNISRSGICFELAENQKKQAKLKAGELVNMTLILEHRPVEARSDTPYPISSNEVITLKGVITWVRDSRYGFHMVSLKEENRNRYNILVDRYEVIEECTGKAAVKNMLPLQPGDVKATYADVSALVEAVGYRPKVSLEDGMAKFVEWYRGYYGA